MLKNFFWTGRNVTIDWDFDEKQLSGHFGASELEYQEKLLSAFSGLFLDTANQGSDAMVKTEYLFVQIHVKVHIFQLIPCWVNMRKVLFGNFGKSGFSYEVLTRRSVIEKKLQQVKICGPRRWWKKLNR